MKRVKHSLIVKKEEERLVSVSRSSVPAWYQCINGWANFFELTLWPTKIIGYFCFSIHIDLS